MGRRTPRDSIDILRERLEAGERGDTDAAREALLALSDNLDLVPSEVGDYRHRDILRRCTRIAEAVGGDELLAALDDRDAAEDIVRWINRTYDNEHTNQDYRKDLRAFGRYHGDITDDPPPSLAWVPTGTSNDFDPRPSERDLLTYDEMQAMRDACANTRDEALIALQFEAGLRGGELQELCVGDVFETEHSHAVHVDGKEGERVVHLLTAVPYLTRWLTDHPAADDDDAPLWSRLDEPVQISDAMLRKALRAAADRADIAKSPTPTNFRKSNTRWLLRLGMKRGKIEQRQGRVQGSKHTARYEAEFGDESLEVTYAALHGEDVDVDDSGTEVAPVTCPRCKESTPREKDFCIHCRGSLDLEARDLLEDLVRRFEDKAIEAEDHDERVDAITASRTLRDRPNMLDAEELHELASSLDSD